MADGMATLNGRDPTIRYCEQQRHWCLAVASNEGMSLFNYSEAGRRPSCTDASTSVVAMLTNRQILVIEPEFLIALEIQRILEQVSAASIIFARSVEEAANLEPRFAEFDLAVIALGVENTAATMLAARLRKAGVAVVGITATKSVEISPALIGTHLVGKPFSDEQLRTACLIALASVPRPATGQAGGNHPMWPPVTCDEIASGP